MTTFYDEIRTERLKLKVLREEQALPFAALVAANKERLQESFPVTVARATDRVTASSYLRELTADRRQGRSVMYGVWLQEELTGIVIVKNIDWRVPKAEVGYFVSEIYEGLGFTSEALRALCRHCFQDLHILKLFARIITTNTRSLQVVERLQFELEGTLKWDHKTGLGEVVDVAYYGLLNREADAVPT